MTNGDDASQEAKYDEIVSKLEALLQKHKGKAPSATAAVGARGYLTTIAGAVDARSAASDNIPTLTETVHIAPAMLSPHSDITSLLGQILDSALKDAGVDLDAAARKALVQALESQLFGF
ncbi:MAG TPA: hypothetical protein VL380_07595 [Nitrosospira sp.]|nr:hypothetical protein [Nitrosospira sp.]